MAKPKKKAELGTFSVPLEVGNLAGGSFVQIDALVDTGATYTVLGGDLLESLGVEPVDRRSFQLADERVVDYDVGEVRLRQEGSEYTVLVVFAPAGTSALLGATALEAFGLSVDPINKRLMPVPALLKRVV
jgi:clan AA aspartic protease